MTDRALVRQLREELYAGSPHLRARLSQAGYDPWRFRGARDVGALPTSGLEELRALPAASLVLRPTPAAMRETWPFGRKLALVLAGGRAARLLEEAYEPVLATEEEGLAVTWTRTDLALAGELGARILDLCGLGPGARLAARLGDEPSFANLMLEHGARRIGVDLGDAGPALALPAATAREALAAHPTPDTLELVLLFGPPPGAAARRDLAAALPPSARLATCWTCGPARVALIEEPAAPDAAPTGLVVFPDLTLAELVEGELVLTNLGSHGTALLRFRTGARAAAVDWTPRPKSGHVLPRVTDLELE